MYCLIVLGRVLPLDQDRVPIGGVRNFLDHLEGGSKIFDTLDGVGQKFFRVLSRKFRDPPHPVLNEHSLTGNLFMTEIETTRKLKRIMV